MRDDEVVAVRSGDESAFAALIEPHRRELRVHCYRMLGSFDEAEDLVQETFLRAWRRRDGFEGRATFRAWLYRIATNACLDHLDGRARRVLPHHVSPPSVGEAVPDTEIPWLQPYPDRLWEPAESPAQQPDSVVIERETIELAFLAAIQHLPPRQRAALILTDVIGWPAKQTAELLETSVASVNSALQRARATLRDRLPERRTDWAPAPASTRSERAVLQRYMAAFERADLAAVADLLAADVRATMPPFPLWMAGRDDVMAALTTSWDPGSPAYVGRFRMVPTGANAQPAAAGYVRGRDDDAFHPFAIVVLRVEREHIAELTAFHDPAVFAAFGLPATLPQILPAVDR
ncbi:MAG TPA: sigma-70 family RNA polymerase sigma factor [Mycobacteriales bacterium]|jgi:RNA polymerase sigma-70 factor (ECF subfamily)|nr:sigma-70 family RNA polymerase sigma factor [Mycobacteriales bacterium]